MRFASMVNCEAADAARFDGNGFFRDVFDKENHSSGLSFRLTSPRVAGVVVDGHRDRDTIALGQGDGQVEIDEEILKDFEARCSGAQSAARVEAIMAMRHVVMESAIGMLMLASP